MKIALAQINPTVGDFQGNAAKMVGFAAQARDAGCELVIFPELATCGYPPRRPTGTASLYRRQSGLPRPSGRHHPRYRGRRRLCGV